MQNARQGLKAPSEKLGGECGFRPRVTLCKQGLEIWCRMQNATEQNADRILNSPLPSLVCSPKQAPEQHGIPSGMKLVEFGRRKA